MALEEVEIVGAMKLLTTFEQGMTGDLALAVFEQFRSLSFSFCSKEERREEGTAPALDPEFL